MQPVDAPAAIGRIPPPSIEARFIAAVVKDGTGERWRECLKLPYEVFQDGPCRKVWRAIRDAENYEAAAVEGRKFFNHETLGDDYIEDRDALFISTLTDLNHFNEWAETLPANNSIARFPILESEPEESEILESVEPIIAGVLEPGDKACISSSSKSFKTWTLIQLAYAVQTGTEWLGFRTNKRRVLFLNFEIKPRNFWKRVFAVRRKMGLTMTDQFTAWNLRGCGFNMDQHAAELIKRAKAIGAGLIILDPIYKLFGDRNESSAGDMATLMALFDKVATETGAAIVYAHHFAKGSAAGKDANDRQSGSGVFARDPDCLIALTRLDENEGENTFAVDVTLRDFPHVDRFGVRREHPILVRDESLNPLNLHDPGRRVAKYSGEQLAALLPETGGLKVSDWKQAAKEKLGISKSSFFDYLPEAKKLATEERGLWHR